MSNPQGNWKALMRSWDIGLASQLEHARHYTTEHPDNFAGWVALADALWSLARYREAKAALRRAEHLGSPRFRHRIWEQRGLLYLSMHDLPSAEIWFRKAVREHSSTAGHIFLGSALALLGRRRDAEREHRAAIAVATPGHAIDEAHLNLALILRSFEQYDEAAKHLREALRINPAYSRAKEVLRDVRRAKQLAKLPMLKASRKNRDAPRGSSDSVSSRTSKRRASAGAP